jgi:tripartite-type tricarboxylate transporter receptor subunit TctC
MAMKAIYGIAAALSALLIAPEAVAQANYPDKTIRMLVGFAPAGPADIIARVVGDKLSQAWGQPVVIENVSGAAANLAGDRAAKSAPDGYTLLMVSGTQTVNETLYSHKQYQLMRDLVPIAPLIDTDLVLVAHPSVPAKNLSELLALARAKPGTINYGSSGPGSNYHMAGELLKNLTGIDIVHVPYKGSTGARNDILSGQVQILFDSVPTMAPMIKAGLVRALATTGKTRSSTLPDVPTIEEAGVPGFNATLWVGFMAPAATPQPIVDKLNQAITKILARPDIKEAWEKTGATPIVMTQPEFKAFMDAQVAKWANVIKANNIPPIN